MIRQIDYSFSLLVFCCAPLFYVLSPRWFIQLVVEFPFWEDISFAVAQVLCF